MSQLLDALQQPHMQLLLRLLLGALLLLAGITKLTGRAGFRQAVTEYDVLPRPLERPFAAALPWLETSLGVLLLLGLGTTVAASLATPLFLSFGVAIGINLLRGRHVDCHCFGSVHTEQIGWPALLRSIALVLAALIVAVGASRFGALEATLFGSSGELPPVGEVIPIVFLTAVIFDVLVLLPEAIVLQSGFARTYGRGSSTAHTNGHHQPAASAAGTRSAT